MLHGVCAGRVRLAGYRLVSSGRVGSPRWRIDSPRRGIGRLVRVLRLTWQATRSIRVSLGGRCHDIHGPGAAAAAASPRLGARRAGDPARAEGARGAELGGELQAGGATQVVSLAVLSAVEIVMPC